MNLLNIIMVILLILELLLSLFFLFLVKMNRDNKILLLVTNLVLLLFLLSKKIHINVISYEDLIFLLVIILILIILCTLYKLLDLQKRYNKIIGYVIEYEKIIDDQGKKNHEFKNQLLVLKGYIDNKKKLKEYLETIVDEHSKGCSFEIKQLHNFPNGGIKELLYCKLARMKENNINFFIYVSEEIKDDYEKLNLKMYKDITKLFGVFLDNAIEEAIKTKKKEIELDFKKDDNFLVVNISNTFNDKDNLSKIGLNGYTTKGKGHGYGLSIVKDILRSNNKIEVVNEIKGEMFVQTILIEI